MSKNFKNTRADNENGNRSLYAWFRGSGTFIGNNYAIYAEGFAPDSPNPRALDAGYESARTFYNPSQHANSSFSKFIAALEQIASNEEQKEKRYLELKIASMENLKKFDPNYISLIKNCFEDGRFSEAITIINKRNKDYDEIVSELSSNKYNAQHSNEFWASQFSTYFINCFYSKNDEGWLPNDIEDLSIDKIVDGYMNSVFGGARGIITEASEATRSQFKKDLQGTLKNHGLIVNEDMTGSIFPNSTNASDYLLDMVSRKTKVRKQNRTIGSMLREISDIIGREVARGMSTELATAGNAAQSLTKGIIAQAGDQLNAKGKKQKEDAFQYELFSTELSQEAIEEIGKKAFKDIGSKSNLGAMKDEFVKAIKEFTTDEIFEISYNIKGYRSKRSLQIEGESSFNSKIDELRNIATKTGIMGTALDKLIFLLVNTTKGCIADRKQELIGKYIAAICIAWMWDDYTEIFNISSGSDTTKLHLFNSGGAYLTASQIIRKTVNDLKTIIGMNNGQSLVQVKITPGKGLTPQEYLQMRNVDSPLTKDGDIQAILAGRWNKVRDDILSSGKLSIHFNQSAIEEMLGYLRTINGK